MGNERYKDGDNWKVKGYADVPVQQASSIPVAPTNLSGNSITDTGLTLTWTKSTSSGVTSQRIYRNTSLFATISDNTTQSYVVTGLTAGTPYRWNVTAFNGTSGVNSAFSNNYNMTTTQTTLSHAPNAPGSFAAVKSSSSPTTSINVSWTAPAVDGTHDAATGYRVYIDGTKYGADLGSGTTSLTITGQTPGTTRTITAKAFNATGESVSTSGISVTLDTVSSGYTMLTGVSNATANYPHGGFTQWDVIRVYQLGTADNTAVLQQSPKIIALTDNSGVPMQGGASSATILENFLESFYYGSGSSSRQNIKIHWANANEYAAKVTNNTAFINTVALMSAVINKTVGGVRRYPNAEMWLDPTQDQERNGVVAATLHPCAQYLDGVAWSLYPPGLKYINPNTSTSDGQFLERCFQRTLAAASAAGKPLKMSCWEVGVARDSADRNHRPYYTCHSLCQWCYERAIALEINFEYICWWDNVKPDGTRDSQMADVAGTSPTTAQAFRNWQSYLPAYGGSTPGSWAGEPTGNTGA